MIVRVGHCWCTTNFHPASTSTGRAQRQPDLAQLMGHSTQVDGCSACCSWFLQSAGTAAVELQCRCSQAAALAAAMAAARPFCTVIVEAVGSVGVTRVGLIADVVEGVGFFCAVVCPCGQDSVSVLLVHFTCSSVAGSTLQPEAFSIARSCSSGMWAQLSSIISK